VGAVGRQNCKYLWVVGTTSVTGMFDGSPLAGYPKPFLVQHAWQVDAAAKVVSHD
jgi:hypothetical protein